MRSLLRLFALPIALLLPSLAFSDGLQVREVVIQQATTNALDTGLLTGTERRGMLVASSEDPSDVRIWSGRSWMRVGESLVSSSRQWMNDYFMTRADTETLLALSIAAPPSLAPLSNSVAAVASDLAAHTSATNPHNVTAAQVGALPLTGGYITGNLVVTNTTGTAGGRFAHGKNVTAGIYATAEGENASASGTYAYASGLNVDASGRGARAVGANSKATNNWSSAAGLNAEAIHECSYVWNADSSSYRSHGNGTWSINPDGGLEGFYVGETNMADHIAAAVAPFEPHYCRWASSDLSKTAVNWIPTNNWPSRNIHLYLYPATSNLVIGIRENWEPTENLSLSIDLVRGGVPADATGGIQIGANTIYSFSASSVYRRYQLNWIAAAKIWTAASYSLGNYSTFSYNSSGNSSYSTLTTNGFAPVIDQQLAESSLSSPQLVPGGGFSPAIIQPDASLNNGSLNELDGLDEPDDFEPAEVVE